MKKIIFLNLVFCLMSFAAHADDVSFICGKNLSEADLNSADLSFTVDDVLLGEDSTPSLTVKGKDIPGIRAVFSDRNDLWTYIITEKAAKNGHAYRQYIFSSPSGCQEDGDRATVKVYQVGSGQGRQLLQKMKCICSAD